VAVYVAGALEPLEAWLYDFRAAHCQRFVPPPTDRVVHLDIDDGTLEAVGAWPWPRSLTAQMIDEIARAEGVTLAEVVRRALDAYLNAERDAAAALTATFGADPDARSPSRDEWDRG
jgi:CHASE2 domain-containing sensor protein